MGAWIETKSRLLCNELRKVAPYVGAWIETRTHQVETCRLHPSHPTWVRGLKLLSLQLVGKLSWSHPTWVRGLKPLDINDVFSTSESHPTWVRGLKHYCNN